MSKITVDENGRIMIPEEEREALGLKPGMTVEIERREIDNQKNNPIQGIHCEAKRMHNTKE